MKDMKVYIFILLSVCLFETKSQIITGDTMSENLNYKEINVSINGSYSQTIQFSIDVDDEGSNDVRFEVYHSGGLGGSFYGSMIYAENENIEFSISSEESSWIDTLSYGNIIDSTLNWIHSSSQFYLIYSGYHHISEPPYTIYYNEGIFSGNDKYVGFRINDDTGIKYGWFQLDSVSLSKIHIKSSVIQKFYQSIDGISINDKQINIYPNPTNSILYVNFPDIGTKTIILSDMHGSIVNKYQWAGRIYNMNLCDLQPGVYFLRIIYDSVNIQRKIIKH